MTINVRVTSKIPKIKATVASGVIVARTLDELLDVDLNNVKDKYVIMYDSSTEKYTAVNPDEIFSAAATEETTQPGLPGDFIDELDTDLNRESNIDIDGGTW